MFNLVAHFLLSRNSLYFVQEAVSLKEICIWLCDLTNNMVFVCYIVMDRSVFWVFSLPVTYGFWKYVTGQNNPSKETYQSLNGAVRNTRADWERGFWLGPSREA